MGGSNSKSSVSPSINIIENHLIRLIDKLDSESVIDSFVQQQLLRAIEGYRNQVEAKSRSLSFSQKTPSSQRFRVRDFINNANNKINKLQIKNYELDNKISKTPQEVRSYLAQVQTAVKSKKIDQSQYEHFLKNIKQHTQNLKKRRRQVKREEEDELSFLILQLYINCPPKKSKQIQPQKNTQNQMESLEKVLGNLNSVRKTLENFDSKNVDSARAKQKLEEIKSEFEVISRRVKMIEESLNQSNRRKEAGTISNQLGNIPKNENNIIQRNEIKPSSSNDVGILRPPKRPAQDAGQRSKFPKKETEIKKSLELLKSVDEKIRSIIGSQKEFREKETTLVKCKQEIIRIETYNNSEVMDRRVRLLNRIYGLSVLETANYLRQTKKIVDDCRNYMPQDDKGCHESKKILQTLLTDLNELKTRHTYASKEVQLIQDKIHETIDMLDRKVEENRNVLRTLEKLDSLRDQIINIGSSPEMPHLQKLAQFNKCRNKLGYVEHNTAYIREKRKEITGLIHTYEEQCLSNDSEYIRSFKKNLNRREMEMQNLTSPINSMTYQQKKNGICSFWKKNIASIETHFGHEMTNVFNDTVNCILTFLEKVKINEVENNIERLNIIEHILTSSTPNRNKLLKPYEDQLQEMKNSATNGEINAKIENIQRKILVEKSKTELINLHRELTEFSENTSARPTTASADVFQSKLNHLFSLKVRFDNLSNDSELNDQKQKFLKKFSIALGNLDEHLLEGVYDRKQVDILDLRDQFEFRPEAITAPKQSVEFVHVIYQNAKSFEERVKNYVGTNYSVEYYVIYENLMRFMEELDKVDCRNNETLLREVLNTVNYIKKLQKQLASVATCDAPGDNVESVQNLLKPIADKKEEINILDLRDQFKFRPESITAPRQSIEFVRIIYQNAKSFEERVQKYVGTNYSVDYYVIYENLMRLLEELDKVNCKKDEKLLGEVLSTMNYIKKLLEQLASVATSD